MIVVVSGLKHGGVEMTIIIIIINNNNNNSMILEVKQNPVQASLWNTNLNHQNRPNKIISTYEQEGVKLLIATV
jgi:hypothetical protein